MSKKKETVCLEKTQIEHIIDASRGEKGACPTAVAFVQKLRPEKTDNPILQTLDKYADKKVQKFIRNFNRWF